MTRTTTRSTAASPLRAQTPKRSRRSTYEEQGWRDFEGDYVDEADAEAGPSVRVVGPGERRRSRLSRVASLAAVLLVAAGGGAVAWLHPEWVGLDAAPAVVSRVEVARPTVKPDIAPPSEPKVDPTVIEPTPVPTPPVVVEPTPPVVEPTPPVVEPTPPVVVAAPSETKPEPQAPMEPLELGETLEVREAGPVAKADGPFPELAIGTRAFAQLHNSEFFIGTVKKRDDQQVTLRLETGEVSLDYRSLRTLAPLGVAETGEVTEAENGYVRLKTEQRLYGTLIRTKKTNEVILRTDHSRITVPAASIVDLGIAKRGSAAPVIDEDDDWLDARARERLLGAPDTKNSVSAEPEPPAPLPTGR